MTEAEINKALARHVDSGLRYNNYIPKPDGGIVLLAYGPTYVALKKMKEWALQFQHEAKLLAPLLAGINLEETVNNIQDFLYSQFQYKLDGYNQDLRSLSRAFWDYKYTGIDCKSYSIIASQILLNLGIKHYFRRIRQEGELENAYTHVYVVVPVDQETASLHDYFVIDGTVKLNNEIPFIKKDDLYMEPNLPIYGLSSPAQRTPSMGCGECSGCRHNNSALGFSVSSIIETVSCIGGSAYDEEEMKDDINAVAEIIDTTVDALNNYAELGNMTLFGKEVAKLQAYSQLMYDTFSAKLAEGWKSPCTKNRLKATKEVANKYNTIGMNAFSAWLNEYFTLTGTKGTFTITSEHLIDDLWAGHVKPYPSVTKQIPVYKIKKTPIRLEISDYVQEFVDGTLSTSSDSGFLSFLSEVSGITTNSTPTEIITSVGQTYDTVTGLLTGNTTSTTTDNVETNVVDNTNTPASTNTAGGWGMALLALTAVGGIFYGTKKFANE